MTSPSARRRIAEDFIAGLKHMLGENFERAILYGSVARGEDGPHSDIDLVVVVRDKAHLEDYSEFLGGWMVDTGQIFQVLILTSAELDAMQGRGSAFAHALRDEGEVLA